MRRLKTLRVRFGVWVAGLLLFVLVAFGALVYANLRQGLLASIDDSLHLGASQAIAAVNVENGQINFSDSVPEGSAAADLRERGLTIRVLGTTGQIIQAVGPYRDLPIDVESLIAAGRKESTFATLTDAVQGEADAVRLHHETHVLDVHMLLMPDGRETKTVAGLPMVRTVQWSQRPHVASTGFYRWMMGEHFTSRDNVFIEDRMHSVLEVAWRKHGDAGWNRYRLWMYHPEGNIKRSTHLDGRAGEDKVG